MPRQCHRPAAAQRLHSLAGSVASAISASSSPSSLAAGGTPQGKSILVRKLYLCTQRQPPRPATAVVPARVAGDATVPSGPRQAISSWPRHCSTFLPRILATCLLPLRATAAAAAAAVLLPSLSSPRLHGLNSLHALLRCELPSHAARLHGPKARARAPTHVPHLVRPTDSFSTREKYARRLWCPM